MFRQYKFRNYNFRLIVFVIALSIIGYFAVGSAKEAYEQKQMFGIALGVIVAIIRSTYDKNWFFLRWE